jgi:hypothetical protein
MTTERNTFNVLTTLHLCIPAGWQAFVGQPVPWPGVTATQTALLHHFRTLISITPSITTKSTLPLQQLNKCTNCCAVFEHKNFP